MLVHRTRIRPVPGGPVTIQFKEPVDCVALGAPVWMTVQVAPPFRLTSTLNVAEAAQSERRGSKDSPGRK